MHCNLGRVAGRATPAQHCRRTSGVITHAAAPEVDLAKSGLKYLPEEARVRAQDRKANKFEKVKVEKCGSNMWTEVGELAKLVREGNTKWEDLNLDDIDIRLKWSGLFHRGKRTPKKFMMRLKVRRGRGARLGREGVECCRPGRACSPLAACQP